MRQVNAILGLILVILGISTCSAFAVPEMGNGWYWPTDYGNNIIFGWLQRNPYFGNKYHIAVDIKNDANRGVYSIGSGDIVAAGEYNGYGDNGSAKGGCVLVRYQAGDGTWFTALYGHLDSYRTSGHLNPGEQIGVSLPDWSPPHLHFGIHPGDSFNSGNWMTGYVVSTSDTLGYTDPIPFLNAHPQTPPCTAANVWWTGTPAQGWYRDDRILYYATSGSNVNVQENPGGADGVIHVNEVGQGWHDYSVHVWNSCGDVTIHWQGGYDTGAPSTNFSAPATSTWLPGGSTVAWNPTDGTSGISSFSFGWDNGSTNGQVPQGIHSVTVSATDNAGNNVTENHGPYWLDTIAPVPFLSGPATSTWLRTPQQVTWGATDATSGVSTKLLTWDNASTAAASPASIPEGKRTATVAATDVAGNTNSQVFGSFWIDTLAPIVSVNLNPSSPNGENGWYTLNPTMSISAIDPNGSDGSGVDDLFYSIDGSEQPFTTEVTISGDGVHSCAGRATDIAGNSGQIDLEVKIDTSAPVFTSVDTELVSNSLDILTASWECDDSESGIAEYEYSVYHKIGGDDKLAAGPVVTTQPYAYQPNLGLVRGETYYLLIRAKNNAGLYSVPMVSQDILATDATRDLAPSFNSGGVSVDAEARTSDNYMLVDSLGQFVVDTSTSSNFILESGYWHSEVTTTPVETVAIAKATDNNKLVQLGSATKPVVVTVAPGVFADRFYVEQPDRSSGIAVQFGTGLTMSLIPGDRVWILGTLNTIDSERIIQFAAPTFVIHDNPLGSLFVNNTWLGGSDLNTLTKGIDGAAGLNNIGLLVKTCGRVGKIDPNGAYFYINDGSNTTDGTKTNGEDNIGVRVAGDGRSYIGQFITVTGISSCFIDEGGKSQRLIRPVTITPL